MSPCIHPPRPEHFGIMTANSGGVSVDEAMAELRRVCSGNAPRRGRSGGSVAPTLPPPSIEYEDGSGPMGWRRYIPLIVIGTIVGSLLGRALGWP